MKSRYDHLNQAAEAEEVSIVEGEQPRFSMGQHDGNDIGIVDLFAAEREGAGQQHEFAPHRWPLFQNGKAADEHICIGGSFRKGEGVRPRLRPGRSCQVFAQYLPGNSDRLLCPN